MRCSKFMTVGALCVLAVGTCVRAEPVDNFDSIVNPDQAKAMAEQLRKEKFVPDKAAASHDTGWVSENVKQVTEYKEQVREQLPEFSDAAVKVQMAKYEEAAKQLSQTSLAGIQNGLEKQVGLSKENASLFGGSMMGASEDAYAIFISFSMSDAEIRNALETASSAGAHVYLNGLKEGHETITQTMKAIRQIAAGIKSPPETRFNSKAFEQFGVKQVPFIVFQEKGKTYTAKGIMNLRWLRGKALDSAEAGDFGVFGPTKPVKERSLVESMKERMATYDWEGQKKKTVETFWSKQQFEVLPAASEDKVWFINPTVRVQADVVNPRGDVLARAGDVINPLNAPTGPQNFIIFDANDVSQLEWATAIASSKRNQGPVMIMTSQLARDKGWDHLESLRKHFNREIYIVPKELIRRFKVTELPVFITPDLQKKVFRVEQHSMTEKTES